MISGTCIGILLTVLSVAADGNISANPYEKWENGPPHSADFFPIAVWLQNPSKAQQYKQAGINTYIGLWRGPTQEQLAQLKAAGMKVICHQNAASLKYVDDSTIIGWMHGDEPDNAQALRDNKGYGPPIAPQKIIDDYTKIRQADPTRPVILNLGQGVAWDNWYGRGVRKNHPEDYPEYIKGCDIASFDIYPACHDKPEIAGKLWYVAYGVDRLTQWAQGRKVVWNCIECTRIHNPNTKATPHQVRCEVWMSIIHGSKGLIYFVHEWEPKFNESALLSDPNMLAEVTAVNRQITELAPVLNSPTLEGPAGAPSLDNPAPVATMIKKYGGATYLFAVEMTGKETLATLTVPALKGQKTAEVLGENRRLASNDGVFKDHFAAWDVHLYQINQRKPD